MNWLYLILISTSLWAHQSSTTSSGKKIFWTNKKVPMVINTESSDLPSATIKSLINASMSQWSLNSTAKVYETSSSINQIHFSSDMSIFGPDVIGVTEINYNVEGAISQATITLNDSYRFTSDQSSYQGMDVYLGDVVTHELGHMFGLSHSEVLDSSMFYSSFPGQSTLGFDDKSAIRSKYDPKTGRIYGYVKGGNHIGVLGVHVQLISRLTGEIASVISGGDGFFEFGGLDLGDSYYIYTSPLKSPDSLPVTYANAQTQFCPGSYVGSFYSPCGRESDGLPQAITLSSATPEVNAGVVTINCNLKTNEDYSYQKIQPSFSAISIWDSNEEIFEKAFVGYFTTSSSWTDWELLNIDLTGVTSPSGKVFSVSLIGKAFGNLLEYQMLLYQNGSLIGSGAMELDPVLGVYKSDIRLAANLSVTTSSNQFQIKIRARNFSADSKFLIPSPNTFATTKNLPHLLLLGLSSNSGLLFNTLQEVSDNESCLDAPFTYAVKESEPESTQTTKLANNSTNPLASSCGTVGRDDDQDGGGTPPALLLGFAMVMVLSHIIKKTKNFLALQELLH